MKLIALLAASAALAHAADALQAFGRDWSVPFASDWTLERAGGEVLRLIQGREPPPGPRRPMQFALTRVPAYARVTVEADVKPLARSLMIVYAYRDEAHFNYAHLSTDTGVQEPNHNGVFHVYGGERVRISGTAGPCAFPATARWYHVTLIHEAATGAVSVRVDGRPIPALDAVDASLAPGRIGLGSFDETAEFKNVKIAIRATR